MQKELWRKKAKNSEKKKKKKLCDFEYNLIMSFMWK